MTTNPRRLVAMIEATDKDYTVTNFLPDIKISYNAKLNRFEIEEIRDYINIAYAPNISDVTLIVGQNGTGKTSLLRKILRITFGKYWLIFKDNNTWEVVGFKGINLYQNERKVSSNSFIPRSNSIMISNSLEYELIALPIAHWPYYSDLTSNNLINFAENYHNFVMRDTTNQIALLLQHYTNGNSCKKLITPFLNLDKKNILFTLNNDKINHDKGIRQISSSVQYSTPYRDYYGYRQLDSADEFVKAYYELQKTLYLAYRQCFISILVYDISYHYIPDYGPIYKYKEDGIKNNSSIPPSIKMLLEYASAHSGTKHHQYLSKVTTFYHYAQMTDDSLFQKLLKLSSEPNWHSWLEAFDAVFNYSGTQPHALFDLESEAFQEFLNHLTDDVFMASGSNRAILDNFLHFLTLPVPQVTEHTKLLTQLQSYLTFEWDGLSSGELSLLNQLGRLHAAKQSIESKHVVLLIDELDLGLHPEWQRRWVRHMLPLIGHIFEDHQVQVIMTTHSPIVLSDIYKDNIIFLKKGPQGQPMVVNNAERQETFGQNIHELFADSFFLGDDSGSVRGDYATNLLNLVIDLLYKKLSHPRDCQQETTNLLQALNLPDDTNEETLKAYLKKIITSTGEPIIAQKLLEMYQEAFSNLEEKIAELEKEIERLRKGASQDD